MKQYFTFFSKLLPLAAAWGLALTAHGQVTYSTVPLTAASYNADIIANGTAAQPPANSTTADVDGAGFFFLSQDYYTATTAHTSGLPNSGLIPNSISGYSALTYQLASYSANNSLRLPGGTGTAGTGTVTFATPTAASEVYVLTSSGSGISTFDVTVNYSDGTTTAFTGQTSPDWFTVSATQNVFGSTSRASTATPVSTPYTAANTAPFLNQLKLTVPATKLSTTITGLTFTKASATTGVLNVMAVSLGVYPICATAPTSAQAVATTTSGGTTALTAACSSTSIYLSLSGVPNNAGYTYQWQSSTTSATTGFTNISGATSSTYTATGQTVTTYYRALISCQFAGTGSTPVASAAVQITQNAPTNCYCTPTYSSGGANDNITRVRLGTLDNQTTGNASPYYHDYTSAQTGSTATLPVPALTQGASATLTLNFGSDGSQYNGVWIDFNQNGTFETTEFFTSGTNAGSSGTATVTLAVPATATLGQTRMRIRGGDDNQPTSSQACGASSSSWGEAEDYFVNIIAAGACTPSTATFSYGTSSSFCVNATSTPAVVLAAGATAGTFTASPAGLTLNATTGAITPGTSTVGTYTVTNTVAATATNCSATATYTVTIAAAPATPTITVTGTPATGLTLTSSATTGNQWSLGNTAIPGATGPTYLVNSGTKNGAYTVTVTNAAGCTATSAATTITVTAAASALVSPVLTVAPNPTPDGRLTVELGGFQQAVTLTVFNALGQRVAGRSVPATTLAQPQTLDLSQLRAGVYVLQARAADGTVAVRRFVRE